MQIRRTLAVGALSAVALGGFAAVPAQADAHLTCEGIAPDARGLAQIAQRTGLHIVAGCGPYVDAHLTVEQRARSPAAPSAASPPTSTVVDVTAPRRCASSIAPLIAGLRP